MTSDVRTPSEMVLHAMERMDERFVTRARKAGLTWRTLVEEMRDEELVGLFVVAEVEMEKRGLLDQEPRRRNIRT